ncbi:hypothetical protein JMJ77_0011346, partial [Colletotrichum scovillei]
YLSTPRVLSLLRRWKQAWAVCTSDCSLLINPKRHGCGSIAGEGEAIV